MIKQLFSVLLSLLLFSPSAFANELGPQAFLQKKINEAKVFLQENGDKLSRTEVDQKLRDMSWEVFDFKAISRSCLRSTWKKITEQERTEFVELFGQVLAATYMRKVREGLETSDIKFVDEKIRERANGKKSALVKTLISLKSGSTAKIHYRLKSGKDGWMVYDVVVEELGLISNFRQEYSRIIRKEKFSGLMEMLRKKVAEIRSAKAV